MTPLSILCNILFFPFDLLGQILAFLWTGLLKTLFALFRSPWGLLIPCTLLAAILAASYLSQNSSELAQHYLKELEDCEEDQVHHTLGCLIQLGESGIPALVGALCQKREAVVARARNTLNAELERWEKMEPEEGVRRCRLLSQALLRRVPDMDGERQEMARRLLQRMLRYLALTPTDRSRTDRSVAARDSLVAARNCERLFSMLEKGHQNASQSDDSLDSDTATLAAHYDSRRSEAAVRASMDRPVDSSLGIAPNSLATARAERLYAYHESPQFQKQIKEPYGRPGMVPDGLARPVEDEHPYEMLPGGHDPQPNEMIASMSPIRPQDAKREMFPTLANTPEKVAGRFAVTSPATPRVTTTNADASGMATPSIASDYLAKNGKAFGGETGQGIDRPPKDGDSRVFLPTDLRDLPIEQVPNLTTSRLMRLLQHNDERYVSEARKTLIARDGFRDVHLKLAFRLFHPIPAVREEIISMLPATTGVQPRVWLAVLLDDPNSDVRYRAASYLATTGDPAMQNLLIERGKRDPDSRIVDLADRLMNRQRNR